MLLVQPVITLCAAAVLAGAGAVLAFFNRMPAAILTFLALLAGEWSGMMAPGSDSLWFWGAAALIASGIAWLVPPVPVRAARLYTVCGALTGAVLGLLAGTTAWVIVASASGAVLGWMAFSRTPGGKALGASPVQWDAIAALGLPAVVNFAMLMLFFSQLIHA